MTRNDVHSGRDGDELSAPALNLVLEALARHGRVLSDYRPAPLGRGVRTRMERLGLTDAIAYVERLRDDRTEAEQLIEGLLLQVTSFFRDPEVFAALERQVLPALVRRAGACNRPFRAWVVGTATGQEAYSLGMVLEEISSSTGIPYEVLATDQSRAALAYARRGIYTGEEAASLPLEARRRFLSEDPSGLRIREDVRQRVRFHHHDLLGPRLSPRESILASFDVVLCRNLLIYLEPRAQALAFERFFEVVVAGGGLVLGSAESIPVASKRFLPAPGVDPALRIFTRAALAPGVVDEGPRGRPPRPREELDPWVPR